MSDKKISEGRRPLTAEQRFVRRKYFGATLVSLLIVSLVGGTIHVLELGSNRMQQMRDMAAIDLDKEHQHLEAAGESLYRNVAHERRKLQSVPYTKDELESMVAPEKWAELDSMIKIPAGSFKMGTNNLRSDSQNRPEHVVTTKAYYIDKYPVTTAQYGLFVAATDYRPPLNWKGGRMDEAKLDHPVTLVTWFNARDYCAWAGKRMPTEAEWEKAARGDDGRRWPWGDVMDSARLNTYYTVGDTSAVEKFPNGVSPYGVYDMAGNVQEWVDADFNPYSGTDAPKDVFVAKIPEVPQEQEDLKMNLVNFKATDMKYKVLRGGSWKSDPFTTSSFHRNYQWPQLTADFYGFRCAKDAQ
ncbi:MAG: formylglycine-generating enzyme family protein [Gammaproteobacteria bacterium]|nr:formylglycine-generating enzyme family protein [Gammaproteobacteria bacterium]